MRLAIVCHRHLVKCSLGSIDSRVLCRVEGRHHRAHVPQIFERRTHDRPLDDGSSVPVDNIRRLDLPDIGEVAGKAGAPGDLRWRAGDALGSTAMTPFALSAPPPPVTTCTSADLPLAASVLPHLHPLGHSTCSIRSSSHLSEKPPCPSCCILAAAFLLGQLPCPSPPVDCCALSSVHSWHRLAASLDHASSFCHSCVAKSLHSLGF
jgi:hypothetical protein